ncbi:MAG: ribonuclease P protein component [Propionibacteriaceae bacterium]|nr:ribonuclease P protein component [Propionibacteriaceae bacterium]
MKSGRTYRRPTLILHARQADTARFGVIVSKKVGGAVQRNRTKRILRHRAAELMGNYPAMDVVVRALPHEGNLRQDLESAWKQAAQGCGS